jgi:hypothetical protein
VDLRNLVPTRPIIACQTDSSLLVVVARLRVKPFPRLNLLLSATARYGPGDTTGFPHGNIGDSCSAMGRIAYYDARARKLSNDPASFETQLGRMQKDLLFYTWMHELYGCDGKMQVCPSGIHTHSQPLLQSTGAVVQLSGRQ